MGVTVAPASTSLAQSQPTRASQRGLVRGLATPFPLGHMLPALYQGDDFSQRLTAALDVVLAPVHCTLDSFTAYLDPRLAPPDFASWLATWVGVALDENWPLERQRTVIIRAVELYSLRGTRKGIAELVRLYVGVEPEVTDSGGVATSIGPGIPMPGVVVPWVKVHLVVPDPASVDAKRVSAIVATVKPAHVRHEVLIEESEASAA